MTALHSVQMPLERYDRNGDEIKPGMHLVTDDGDKMYAFSLPSLYIVADQGTREANLAYAAECIRTGKGEFYPLDFLILGSWEIKKQASNAGPQTCGPFSFRGDIQRPFVTLTCSPASAASARG